MDEMKKLGDAATSLTASAQHLTEFSRASIEARNLALYHAKLILGCYPSDAASDPEVFIAAVASVLSRYPADVGARLSDPKNGIGGKIKWLPRISELKDECDALIAADARAIKRRADLALQFKLRDEFEERMQQPYQPSGLVLRDYEEAFRLYGRPIGVFEKPGDTWNRDQRRPQKAQAEEKAFAERLAGYLRDGTPVTDQLRATLTQQARTELELGPAEEGGQ